MRYFDKGEIFYVMFAGVVFIGSIFLVLYLKQLFVEYQLFGYTTSELGVDGLVAAFALSMGFSKIAARIRKKYSN